MSLHKPNQSWPFFFPSSGLCRFFLFSKVDSYSLILMQTRVSSPEAFPLTQSLVYGANYFTIYVAMSAVVLLFLSPWRLDTCMSASSIPSRPPSPARHRHPSGRLAPTYKYSSVFQCFASLPSLQIFLNPLRLNPSSRPERCLGVKLGANGRLSHVHSNQRGWIDQNAALLTDTAIYKQQTASFGYLWGGVWDNLSIRLREKQNPGTLSLVQVVFRRAGKREGERACKHFC